MYRFALPGGMRRRISDTNIGTLLRHNSLYMSMLRRDRSYYPALSQSLAGYKVGLNGGVVFTLAARHSPLCLKTARVVVRR